jgi:MFS transporter, DHA1 family, multidrug resistance protein
MYINISKVRHNMILISLLIIFPLSGMAVDLFSPSLPAMSQVLDISTSLVKATIYIYLTGYALGNFLMGFLTDALGRKKLLRISLFLLIISNILPILFPNYTMLLTSRFIQGLFVGAVAVLARAILSDILSSTQMIKIAPIIGALWGLGPVLGPILGGYLQFYLNWTAGFYFFAISSTILSIIIYIILPETISNYSPLKFKIIRHNLYTITTNLQFMTLVISMGLVYALLITFNTLGPFLIQDMMGYSSIYFGQLSLIVGLIFLSSTFICRYLLNYMKPYLLFGYVTYIFIIIIVILSLFSLFFPSSLALLIVATTAAYFVCGFIFPLCMGKGISMFQNIAGTATAVMYLINVMITSLAAFVETFIHSKSIIPIMFIYSSLMFILLIIYWICLHKERNKT